MAIHCFRLHWMMSARQHWAHSHHLTPHRYLIADTHYEVPVAFEVTRASDSEVKMLPKMLETLFAKVPEMADRCDDFSADRTLDNAPQKK